MAGIGENIKKRRLQLGITQEDLANRMGYKTKSSINKIEMGINDVPQSKIVKFASALETTPAVLMGWEVGDTMTEDELILSRVKERMELDDNFREIMKALARMPKDKVAAMLVLFK